MLAFRSCTRQCSSCDAAVRWDICERVDTTHDTANTLDQDCWTSSLTAYTSVISHRFWHSARLAAALACMMAQMLAASS